MIKVIILTIPIFRDIINPMIIEEVKPIQLRITIQPGDTAVFKYDKVLNPNHGGDDVKMSRRIKM